MATALPDPDLLALDRSTGPLSTGRIRTGRVAWHAAAALYDAPDSPLPALAQDVLRGRADAVAGFVAAVMGALRGRPVPALPAPRMARLLTAKYGAALAGGLLGLAAGPVGFVAGFYAVEAQMVFLAPVLLDQPGASTADILWRCRDLTGRSGGTLHTMRGVLPIAVRMLLGGLRDGDPVRAWSLGAIAVVLWYEDLLAAGPLRCTPQRQLDLGNHSPLYVREERVDRGLGLRLIHASDLHLQHNDRSRRTVDAIVAACAGADALLLGGDLLDAPSGRRLLADLVRRVPRPIAITGNHDTFIGERHTRAAVLEGGGTWLTGRTRIGRLTIDTLPRPGTGPRLLLVHKPREARRAQGYDVALAGHLHGGQVVWFEGRRQWPTAAVYPLTGKRFTLNGMRLLVNQGAADTVPIRWRCTREVLALSM
jgi:predicted MPP superfamily phosphohydrolase